MLIYSGQFYLLDCWVFMVDLLSLEVREDLLFFKLLFEILILDLSLFLLLPRGLIDFLLPPTDFSLLFYFPFAVFQGTSI